MEAKVSFPANWAPPRELARALPREVSMSVRGTFMAILSVVFLVATVPLFIFVRNQDLRQAAPGELLRTQGREAQGEVTRLWRQTNPNTPMVTYEFSAGDRRLEGNASVPEKLWNAVRKAGFLPIRYLPSDPSINHPVAWQDPPPPVWLPFFLPAFLVGCSIVLVVSLRRQARLAAEGCPSVGVVTGCYRVKRRWSVRYQFRTKDGVTAKGSSRLDHPLDTGAAICVLHLPENPRRNQIYPLPLYRVRI
jgi:hypothetical protein